MEFHPSRLMFHMHKCGNAIAKPRPAHVVGETLYTRIIGKPPKMHVGSGFINPRTLGPKSIDYTETTNVGTAMNLDKIRLNLAHDSQLNKLHTRTAIEHYIGIQR